MKTKINPADLLAQLEQRQILLFAEGDRLMVRGKLDAHLRQQLIDLKPELLQIAPRRRWWVTPPGREAFGVDCVAHPMTSTDLLIVWPGADVRPQS